MRLRGNDIVTVCGAQADGGAWHGAACKVHCRRSGQRETPDVLWTYQARWIYYLAGLLLLATAGMTAFGGLFGDVWRATGFASVGHMGDYGFGGAFALMAFIVAMTGNRPGALAQVVSIIFAVAVIGFMLVGGLLVHFITHNTPNAAPLAPLVGYVLAVDAGVLLLGPIVHMILFRRQPEE